MDQLQSLLAALSEQNKQKKIIYPDIDDQRVYDAVNRLIEGGENPVICGKKDELKRYQKLIDHGLEYYEVPELEENTIFAAKILSDGKVNGYVGGNISTTSDVVRALIKNVGSLERISRISSYFLMGKGEDLILFSDAGIQIDPTSDQLAEIGYLTAMSAISYGLKPRVAMLSFSTAGSGGNHESVIKVREATQQLRERLEKEKKSEEIIVEGEVQFDAAFVPEVGKRKNPNTLLESPANVYIYPDLNSANIAYKIAQRLAGFIALGPVIQGLRRPGNDLSRGCSTEDIVAMHHITKNQ